MQNKNIEAIYPLSPMQQGMLFHTLYRPDEGVYVNQLNYDIEGKLDASALQLAWQQVVDQHPVLRTFFAWEKRQQPLQIVRRNLSLPWQFHDWRDQNMDQQQPLLEDLLWEDRKTGFHLDKAPLMRCCLVQLSDEKWHFIWTHHHLILDGWSGGLIQAQVVENYELIRLGHPLVRSACRPYVDYIQWLQQQSSDQDQQYWSKQLASISSPTPLPFALTRKDQVSLSLPKNEPPVESLNLEPVLYQRLKDIARQYRLTLNCFVQAAWALLLSRCSGEETVLFGVTSAGRPPSLDGVESMVGLFINTLPVCCSINEDLLLKDWLSQLMFEQGEREQHSHCALADIQRWSHFPTNTSLFESVVVFENHLSGTDQAQTMRSGGHGALHIGPMQVHEKTNFAITLVAELSDDSLQLKAMYDDLRFSPQSIGRVLHYINNLLVGMAESLMQPVSALQLLDIKEQQQCLAKHPILQTFTTAEALTQTFSKMAQQYPTKIALRVPGSGIMDYQTLDRRSDQLAFQLLRVGVGQGERVGIHLPRDLDMVVAIIGILKAGANYVVLEPSMPVERRQYIIEDASLQCLVTNSALAKSAVDLPLTLIFVEDVAKSKTVDVELPTISPDQSAYVIYTSGSTGQPKGVEVSHHNVQRLFAATNSTFGFHSQDVWTLFHSFAFDFSVWELWGALLFGGELVIVPSEISQSPREFWALIEEHNVTVLNQTPSAFYQLISAATYQSVKSETNSLRCVVFGGEALDVNALLPWFECYGDQQPQLINMYGITEITVHATLHRVLKSDVMVDGSVIGYPLSDLCCFILDSQQTPVADDLIGEIYVGGAGVAKGYLNRPTLSADRFITLTSDHPLCQLDPSLLGLRLYRSGDLARRTMSGDLVYCGRMDDQVKVRGFRIELGEIEAALYAIPAVTRACVLSRPLELGNQLIAFIEQHSAFALSKKGESLQHQVLDTAQWQTQLQDRLPSYMVPAHFIEINTMPMTANGKLDKTSLLALTDKLITQSQNYVAPRDETEELLVTIWQQVLSVASLGVEDNYFSLGGDSIRSMSLLAQANKAGLALELKDIYDCPTVSSLARRAVQKASLTITPELNKAIAPFELISTADAARLPERVVSAYPLTRLQSGMWFHSLLSKGGSLYHNISSYLIEAPYDPALLTAVIQQVANQHDVMRTRFDFKHYSQPLQLVFDRVDAPIEIVDTTDLSPSEQEQQVNRWFDEELHRYFSIDDFPLFRFTIHHHSDRRFQLSLTEHHAIFDGWSVASLMADIFQLYRKSLAAQEPLFTKSFLSVPVVQSQSSIHYRDFVAAEQASLASVASRHYWQEVVQGVEPLLIEQNWAVQKPIDTEKSKSESNELGCDLALLHVEIPSDLSEQLTQVAQTLRVPIKSVLLACHLRVLALLSYRRQVVTGLVVNGRLEQEGGDSVLGLFLNTVPFKLDFDDLDIGLKQASQTDKGAVTWAQLIQACFQKEWQMLPHRRFPLADIQQLGTSSTKGQNIFNTTFNFTYFHVYQQALDSDELRVVDGRFFEKTNFALSTEFGIDPQSGQLNLVLDYDPEHLSLEFARLLGDYYQLALQSVAKDVHSPMSVLSPVSEMPVSEMIEGPKLDFDQIDLPFIRRFEQQVLRSPNAVAVEFGEVGYSYQQLNHKANLVAHELLDFGIQTGDVVGVCLDRSLMMLVGLLAVAKTGAAYVPLDPGFPSERLKLIVEDVQPKVLLVDDTTNKQVGHWQLALPQMQLHDQSNKTNESQLLSNPQIEIGPDHLAYVIYTSGSTGRPKGVEVSQLAMANFLCAMAQRPGIESRDKLLAVTTISFDIAVLELYLPLMVGACVVIADRETTQQGGNLAALIDHCQATMMQATPASWRMLLAAGWRGSPSFKALSGGEALALDLAKSLQERVGQLWNMYGPTETTVWSCTHQIKSRVNDNSTKAGIAPLGRPIANTQLWVVDPFGQTLASGCIGELVIAGAGVAQGYRNQAQLTEEKFGSSSVTASKLSSALGDRWYKTSDLVYFDNNGLLHYVGRADQQIKLRGFRIELGEIEFVLAQVSGVAQVAVSVFKPNHEDSRLVAFVVPLSGSVTDALQQQVIHHARQYLPSYMVPASVIVQDSLPLTPNGKVDRKQLVIPETLAVNLLEDNVLLAESVLEQQITSLWCELLSVKQVGVEHNFFDVGGNSLLLVRLHGRLEAQFDVRLELVELFNQPTVRAQARYVERLLSAQVHSPTDKNTGGSAANLQVHARINQRTNQQKQHLAKRAKQARGRLQVERKEV